MTPGLGESVPGVEQSRAGNETGVDRARQPVVGAGGIANRSESSLQRRFQVPSGVLCEQGFGHALDRAEIGARGKGVVVRIDQAGHQRATLQIDHLGGRGANGNVRNLRDPIPVDEHLDTFEELLPGAVEYHAVTKQCAHVSFSRSLSTRRRQVGEIVIRRGDEGLPNPQPRFNRRPVPSHRTSAHTAVAT